MKKGDLVKRVRKSKESFYDELKIGDSGIIIKGPYEENITDIAFEQSPWKFRKNGPKFTVLKRVVDLMCENRIYKYCIVDDYEREKL